MAKDPYCEKYDHTNEGTVYVFEQFYKILAKDGFISNVVAVCGEDLDRYIKQVWPIVSKRQARAFFIEDNHDRYLRLKTRLAEYTDPNIQKRIRVIKGDIAQYLKNKKVGLKRPARIEDIGIGTGKIGRAHV